MQKALKSWIMIFLKFLKAITDLMNKTIMKIMMESGADTTHNNIVVYNGGAEEWQISGLSAEEKKMWEHSFPHLLFPQRFKAYV